MFKTARVLEWATLAPSPQQRRNRLLTVRRFALALSAEDRRHEVPPADALGRGLFERRIPHIYTAGRDHHADASGGRLKPAGSIRPLLYETLFGLLAATGMRVSEALALRLDDLTADGLVIRQTKFQKSRLLPLHATTWEALDGMCRRASGSGPWTTPCSFPYRHDRRPITTVIAIFLRLARSTGLRAQPRSAGAAYSRSAAHLRRPLSGAVPAMIATPLAAISSRSAPTSATPMSPTPTGTCRRRRS